MWEVKTFYDEFKKTPADVQGRKRLTLRMRKSASLLKSTGTVVDVGCRNGFFREYLPSSAQYVGVDITKKWWNGTFDFILAVASNLPFKTGSVDNIVALELLEHLFTPKTFVEEAHRVLNDEGFFVLSTPNIACLLNRFKIIFGMMPSHIGVDPGHLHCFTYDALSKFLAPLFRVTRRASTYVFFPLRRITNKVPLPVRAFIASLLPNLAEHIIVRAEKSRRENVVGSSLTTRDDPPVEVTE